MNKKVKIQVKSQNMNINVKIWIEMSEFELKRQQTRAVTKARWYKLVAVVIKIGTMLLWLFNE